MADSNTLSKVPHVYVISLKSRPDRLANIEIELKKHGLEYTIVQAYTPESSETKEMAIGVSKTDDSKSALHTVACFASHLAAHKRILADQRSEAIVMEDDVILRKNFSEEYIKVRSNFPDSAELVYLGCIHGSIKRRVLWDGKDKEQHNLIRRRDPIVWGTQCYYLTSNFAEKTVHIFSRPAVESMFKPTQYTSELISCITIPYMIVPMLAIEDYFLVSEIRNRTTPFPDFVEWGPENYGVGEWRTKLMSYLGNSTDKSTLAELDLSSFSDVALLKIALFLSANPDSDTDDKRLVAEFLSARTKTNPSIVSMIRNNYNELTNLYS